MVGFLASFIYVRMQLRRADSFHEHVARIASELDEAYRHRDGGRLKDMLFERAAQMSFNWLSTDWSRRAQQDEQGIGSLELQPFGLRGFAAREADEEFRLAVTFADTGDSIVMSTWYRGDLFRPRTIQRFMDEVVRYAERCRAGPDVAGFAECETEGRAADG
jgi:hypothetical protein